MSLTAGNGAAGDFPATLDSLHEMLSFVNEGARLCSDQEPFFLRVRLACEEAIVNIIRHSKSEHGIGLEYHVEGKEFVVKLIDQGIPFDPLLQQKVVPESKLSKNEGSGIRLMFSSADDIRYSRDGRKNCLTLFFKAP